ncbi:tyrosine-type recombinase/integrase [Rhizobium sp. BE258]|uniref:tyrosine-type recombinase/integrase n=1 Tax=Rhizobium sp. BE258 TaxID=2817722 RepID=UPI002865C59D|nr:tyrosine-type recombinase/integrase [Rhizobium sp. BE258]MDR7147070.1 integrase [Rhizobium sp. BE258]
MAGRVAKSLTMLTVKGAQGNGVTRQELPDAALPGLYLVIQPGGRKSWALRYRQGGKPAKLTLGPVLSERETPLDEEPKIGSAMTLPEARAVARRQIQALTEGQDLARRKKEEVIQAAHAADSEKDFLVEAQAQKFIERYAKKKNKSWQETERQFAKEIAGYEPKRDEDYKRRPWEGRDVRDIRKADVVKLLDAIVDRGSPVTANRIFATLHTWFDWMIGRDVLKSHPMAGMKKPTPENSRERVLTHDELRVFWQAASAAEYPFGPMWKLLALTAQRRQEVAGMEWKELTLSGNSPRWLIPGERTKNGRENLVHLSATALALIKGVTRIGKCAFVLTTTLKSPVSGFSRSKARLDTAMLEIMKKEAAEQGRDPDDVKLPQWGLHDLRRTAASGMASLKIGPHVVEAILNHSSGEISGVAAIYNRHSYEDEKREALDKWESYLLQIVGETTSNVVSLRA